MDSQDYTVKLCLKKQKRNKQKPSQQTKPHQIKSALHLRLEILRKRLLSTYLKGKCFCISPITSLVWKDRKRTGSCSVKGKRGWAVERRGGWEGSPMRNHSGSLLARAEGLERTEMLKIKELVEFLVLCEHPALWLPPFHPRQCSNTSRKPSFILKCLVNCVWCQQKRERLVSICWSRKPREQLHESRCEWDQEFTGQPN